VLGLDRGTSLVDLLRVLVVEKRKNKLNLRNMHPRFLLEILPGLIEVLRGSKIGFNISAVQCGDEGILELMQRGYKNKDFINASLPKGHH
jgi:tRNA A37 methylthiotransferase MiaB